MTSKLLSNQTKRRLLTEGTHNITHQKMAVHTNPITVQKTLIDPVNTISDASFGSDVRFRLPFEKIIGCYAVIDTGTQATNGWYDEFGLSVFEEVRLTHGGSTLEEFNYTDACYESISRMDSEAQSKVLTLAGGASLTTGQTISPMPVCFDRFSHPDATPFDCRGLGAPVELILKMRAIADLTNSNVASNLLNSIKLAVIYVVEPDTEPVHNYHGLTYQSIPEETIATATTTDVDISALTGQVQELVLLNRIATDISSNYDWGIFAQDCELIEVRCDGKKVYENYDSFQEDNVYESLFHHNFKGTGGSVDGLQRVNFAYNQHPSVWGGSLPVEEYNKIVLRVQHSGGANTTFSVLARSHLNLKVVGGRWHKQE